MRISEKTVEKHYPKFFAGFCFVAVIFWNPAVASTVIKDISSSLLVICSIFCGFLATSVSILFSISQTNGRSIRALKSSGIFKGIASYLWEALVWNFLSILTSFSTFFFIFDNCTYKKIVVGLLLSVGLGAFTAMYRVTRLFIKILQD